VGEDTERDPEWDPASRSLRAETVAATRWKVGFGVPGLPTSLSSRDLGDERRPAGILDMSNVSGDLGHERQPAAIRDGWDLGDDGGRWGLRR